MTKRGSLFVISAPSGAGKTTLLKELMSRRAELKFSVSYTTRPPRPGEVNDTDYTFIDEPTFKEMIERGEFVEWARVHTAYYGTSKRRLQGMLNEGLNVVLDIDVSGARQIRGHFTDAVYIFILPPSLEVLSSRLRGRGNNTQDDIKVRLGNAKAEISAYSMYNYVIINDKFEDALLELDLVVTASGLRVGNIEPRWVERHFLKEED